MWAARVLVYGFDLGPEQAYHLLATEYNPRCAPEWSERELRHKLEDADRCTFGKPRGWLRDEQGTPRTNGKFASVRVTSSMTGADTRPPLPLVYYSDIRAGIDVADFVQGLLIDGAMSVIYGESGSGKTFFTLDLAIHVAAGLPWRGRAVDQRGVLYLALEGQRGISNRVEAFKIANTANTAPVALAIVPVAIDLLDPAGDTGRVIEAAKAAAATLSVPVGLIVVDTLSRAMSGGNENASEDMGALIKNIDRIRQELPSHVSIVHHSGKDGAKGARGHSSLRAATDTEIEVSRNPIAKTSVARVTKQRELELGDEFVFCLQRVELGIDRRGNAVTSCVVREAGPVPVFVTAVQTSPVSRRDQQMKLDENSVMVAVTVEIDNGQCGATLRRIRARTGFGNDKAKSVVERLVVKNRLVPLKWAKGFGGGAESQVEGWQPMPV
jgi:hypothetical protein